MDAQLLVENEYYNIPFNCLSSFCGFSEAATGKKRPDEVIHK